MRTSRVHGKVPLLQLRRLYADRLDSRSPSPPRPAGADCARRRLSRPDSAPEFSPPAPGVTFLGARPDAACRSFRAAARLRPECRAAPARRPSAAWARLAIRRSAPWPGCPPRSAARPNPPQCPTRGRRVLRQLFGLRSAPAPATGAGSPWPASGHDRCRTAPSSSWPIMCVAQSCRHAHADQAVQGHGRAPDEARPQVIVRLARPASAARPRSASAGWIRRKRSCSGAFTG